MSGNQLELTGVATVFRKEKKKKSIDLTAWDFFSFFLLFFSSCRHEGEQWGKAGRSGARRKKGFRRDDKITVMFKWLIIAIYMQRANRVSRERMSSVGRG